MDFLKFLHRRKIPVAGINQNEIIKTKQRFEHLTQLTKRLDELELMSCNQFEMLKVMTNELDISIWGKTKNGVFRFLNQSCADKILKVSIEDALNMTEADFKNDKLGDVCLQSDKVVMDAMATKRFIEHANYETGPMWIDSTKSPWIKDDKLIGTVGSAKDITNVVPQNIKDKYSDSGFVEIDIDLLLSEDKFDKILKH